MYSRSLRMRSLTSVSRKGSAISSKLPESKRRRTMGIGIRSSVTRSGKQRRKLGLEVISNWRGDLHSRVLDLISNQGNAQTVAPSRISYGPDQLDRLGHDCLDCTGNGVHEVSATKGSDNHPRTADERT